MERGSGQLYEAAQQVAALCTVLLLGPIWLRGAAAATGGPRAIRSALQLEVAA